MFDLSLPVDFELPGGSFSCRDAMISDGLSHTIAFGDHYLFDVMTNLWILSSFAAAYVAALFWLAALRTMDLSYAYPFMALSFVLVLLLSAAIFGESLSTAKVAGVILICIGVAISAQGQ